MTGQHLVLFYSAWFSYELTICNPLAYLSLASSSYFLTFFQFKKIYKSTVIIIKHKKLNPVKYVIAPKPMQFLSISVDVSKNIEGRLC